MVFFGVTVEPSFRESERGRVIMRRHTAHMLIYVVAGILLTFISARQNHAGLASAALGIVAIGSIITLVEGNRRVWPFAVARDSIREAFLTIRHDKLPGGWILWILPFLILAASGLNLHEHWDQIPDRFPIHWGINGEPNGWANKSAASVYGMLFLGAGICLTMTAINYSIVRSRRIALQGTAAEFEQSFRSMNVWTLLATEYFMAFLFAGIPLLSIFQPGSVERGVLVNIGLTVLFFVVIVLVYLRYEQGGTRLAGAAAVTQPPIGDRTPDQCWKMGHHLLQSGRPFHHGGEAHGPRLHHELRECVGVGHSRLCPPAPGPKHLPHPNMMPGCASFPSRYHRRRGGSKVHIALAADHAGYDLKQFLAKTLTEAGHSVLDLGTQDPSSPDDYPDYAEALGLAVLDGRAERGVLICGSGVGAAVAANKIRGIRAGLCHDSYSAHQGVEHDNMNILVLGSRVIGVELAREITIRYLAAQFTGEPRHVRRLAKVKALEEKAFR